MLVFDWNESFKAFMLNRFSMHCFKINAHFKINEVFNIESKLNLVTLRALQIDAQDRHLVATVQPAT